LDLEEELFMELNENTLIDFDSFLEFVANDKPKVTTTGRLGKKDLYVLNEKLFYASDVDGPKYNQEKYVIIDLLVRLSSQANLINKKDSGKEKSIFVKTPVCIEYEKLNPYEKYLFLLQTFWLYQDKVINLNRWNLNYALRILKILTIGRPGQKIHKSDLGPYYMAFAKHAPYFLYLEFLGFGEVEKLSGNHFSYEDSISAFIPNEFGIEVSQFLSKKAINLLNSNKSSKEAFKVFQTLFPNEVEYTVYNSNMARGGVYIFKVSLGKLVWRKIAVAQSHTLKDLHLAIQNAFDFDNDHLYVFFLGPQRKSTAIYCAEAKKAGLSTEETTISALGLFSGQTIYYLFDFGDEWTFEVVLLSIEDEPIPKYPEVIEICGEAPPQYNWEDDDF